ncbi:MFS transporter [Plantibacter sp. CFBP 8798]|uniref:MFS transporter n=1 Tax=Plantibacter sp. CFBP 8798 TaxID=2775268 RepID=UPI0020182C47|nr:MFS transporter [Plantibacter sp. CFBP 8798]
MTTSTVSTRSRVSHGAGFWIVATTFLLVMAYSTVPTPLYALYQARDGFPVSTITVIFAAYAVGVVFSLFFVGHISDWVGRRRMLLIAILISALSAVLFLLWSSVEGLIVARIVNGVSIGVLTATATAHLGELRAVARPDENSIVAASVAGASNLGGLALGPLIGGLFAEFLPNPLVLPHAVFLVALVIAAIVMVSVPETVEQSEPRRRYRPQRLAVPASSRGAFIAAGFGAFAGFALLGLFTSLAPTILIGTFDAPDHLLAGVTTFSVFGAAALGQVLLARLPLQRQLLIATVSCGIGLAAVAAGAVLPQLGGLPRRRCDRRTRCRRPVQVGDRDRRIARRSRPPGRDAVARVPDRLLRPRTPGAGHRLRPHLRTGDRRAADLRLARTGDDGGRRCRDDPASGRTPLTGPGGH